MIAIKEQMIQTAQLDLKGSHSAVPCPALLLPTLPRHSGDTPLASPHRARLLTLGELLWTFMQFSSDVSVYEPICVTLSKLELHDYINCAQHDKLVVCAAHRLQPRWAQPSFSLETPPDSLSRSASFSASGRPNNGIMNFRKPWVSSASGLVARVEGKK